VVGFDAVIGRALLDAMPCRGTSSSSTGDRSGAASATTSVGVTVNVVSARTVEEPSGSVGVASSRDQNVDDLPVPVGGAKWEQDEYPNRLVRRPCALNRRQRLPLSCDASNLGRSRVLLDGH
jgi:hypothetical protein